MTLGYSNGRTVEIKSGVRAGEFVVLKPLPLLPREQQHGADAPESSSEPNPREE